MYDTIIKFKKYFLLILTWAIITCNFYLEFNFRKEQLMKGMNRNRLINICIVIITCIIIAVCFVICGINSPTSSKESESSSIAETNADNNSSFATETDSFPKETNSSSEITFSSQEETYNYAVSQINAKKYYSAIKYLRQIPGYKDADTLQTKVYKLINADYFAFSAEAGKVIACEGMNSSALASNKVVTRTDSSISNDEIAQRGSYWYLDTDGNFHTVGVDTSSQWYNTYAKPILEYNKKVKFELIFLNSFDAGTQWITGLILTKTQDVIHISIDPTDKWGNFEVFKPLKQDYLRANEKIVYISSDCMLSNMGTIFFDPHTVNSVDAYISWSAISHEHPNLVSIQCAGGGIFLLKDDGTVALDYREQYYPCIKDWSDIISIEQCGYCNYYCGLTSDGKILLALYNSSNSIMPFPATETYVAITSYGNYIAALSKSGNVYTYLVPDLNI